MTPRIPYRDSPYPWRTGSLQDSLHRRRPAFPRRIPARCAASGSTGSARSDWEGLGETRRDSERLGGTRRDSARVLALTWMGLAGPAAKGGLSGCVRRNAGPSLGAFPYDGAFRRSPPRSQGKASEAAGKGFGTEEGLWGRFGERRSESQSCWQATTSHAGGSAKPHAHDSLAAPRAPSRGAAFSPPRPQRPTAHAPTAGVR